MCTTCAYQCQAAEAVVEIADKQNNFRVCKLKTSSPHSPQSGAKVGREKAQRWLCSALLETGCLGKLYLLLCLLHCGGTRVTELLLLSAFALQSENVKMIKLAAPPFAVLSGKLAVLDAIFESVHSSRQMIKQDSLFIKKRRKAEIEV